MNYYSITMLVLLDNKEDHDELRDKLTRLSNEFMAGKHGRSSFSITGDKVSESTAYALIEERRTQALRDSELTEDSHVEFGGKVHVHKEPS